MYIACRPEPTGRISYHPYEVVVLYVHAPLMPPSHLHAPLDSL